MAKFDLQKTSVLSELLARPADKRDTDWVERLTLNAADASMAAGDPPVRRGPDGFEYFWLQVPPANQPFEAYSIAHILRDCTERGVGCVLDGVNGAPPWVFSYGNLWSLRADGHFGGSRDRHRRPPSNNVLVASPSEDLFPKWARAVMRSWLAHVGVQDPGVALMVDAGGEDGPVEWLCFSVFADQFKDEGAYRDFMGRLHWFLPSRLAARDMPRGVLEYRPL